MRIVDQSFEVFRPRPADDLYLTVETAGRLSHASKGEPAEREAFIRRLIEKGHDSVLEHEQISVVIKTDRGVMAELTRHRHNSFTIASTRAIDYSRPGLYEVIRPWPGAEEHRGEWHLAMLRAERAYLDLLMEGRPPELARSVLPQSFATDMFMTGNIRQWRTVFKQRVSRHAHPQMRDLMEGVLAEFKRLYPAFFDDIKVD